MPSHGWYGPIERIPLSNSDIEIEQKVSFYNEMVRFKIEMRSKFGACNNKLIFVYNRSNSNIYLFIGIQIWLVQ